MVYFPAHLQSLVNLPRRQGATPTRASTRLEEIKKSGHYKKGRFENILSTPMLGEGSSYWSVIGKYFGKGVNRAPAGALPFIRTNLKLNPSDHAMITVFLLGVIPAMMILSNRSANNTAHLT